VYLCLCVYVSVCLRTKCETQCRDAFIDHCALTGTHTHLNKRYPKTKADWVGLFRLIVETREAFSATPSTANHVISMAYYPDKRQEAELAAAPDAVAALDYMHMMSYDQHGQHSTWEFGKQAVR
jgi:GH18 family chitinase